MRVLVSVASRHGSTNEIGAAIARTLEADGLEVDVLAPRDVASVDLYDAVVLGSGIYAGRWLGSARDLVERECDRLLARPVWLFSSGPIGNPPKPEQVSPDAVAIRDRVKAVDHQVFEGRLDRSILGIGERLIVSAVRAEPGDYRPWDVVMEWSRGIAAALRAGAAAAAGGVPAASAR
jgi:menaquinone-dependent protoporphyrinogen oxidase